MVTYCATKLTAACSPMIGQILDTMILASTDEEWFNDPSKSTSWKMLETVSSHLKCALFVLGVQSTLLNIA